MLYQWDLFVWHISQVIKGDRFLYVQAVQSHLAGKGGAIATCELVPSTAGAPSACR